MADPLRINDTLVIPAAELHWAAVRASGPGGQNVNKVASKVELRFDLRHTRSLDAGSAGRLFALAENRVDKDGQLVIVSQVHRDQQRNLEDAREKLRALIVQALVVPKRRRKTKPSRAAKEKRLTDKRLHSQRKQARGKSTGDY
ncbi:MAG TPA: alternative ribosome rescue aminoacyl-tRNA hydrolase ArfB [Polyangiaceae bacterium]|nr:alternative ribosome rescue aminoacyl-tRNA hydrolase ArfB [Polyangiaceae bacterium]